MVYAGGPTQHLIQIHELISIQLNHCLGLEPVKEGSSGRISRYLTRTAAMEPITRNPKTTKIVMDGRHGDNRQR